MTTPSLYTLLLEAGCKLDNHESDLYVLDTPEARAIIEAHGTGVPCAAFRSQVDGKRWLDLPFHFAPWWEHRQQLRRTL